MSKVGTYNVVENDDLDALSLEVTMLLNKGYRPHGSLVVVTARRDEQSNKADTYGVFYLQPMILFEYVHELP